MIDDMVSDHTHILPMYTFLQDRKAAQVSPTEFKDAARFDKISTFGSVDDDFRASWITSNSDMSAANIIAAVKKDPAAIDHLCTFACQINCKQKLPQELLNREVCRRVLDARHEACGNRLHDFKKRGGLTATGELNWLKGSYEPKFDNEAKLIGIRHRSGDEVEVDPSLGINMAWTLNSNFDDFAASMSRAPLPPVRLASFFPLGLGPHKYPNFVGKPKLLHAFAAEVNDACERSERAARDRVTPAEAVRTALEDHKKSQARSNMAKARIAAKASLDAKKERLRVKLTK